MAVLDFPGDVVPLDKEQIAKLRKDLHPAQLLLVCLNSICPQGPPQKPSEPPLDHNQSPEEFFHTFVNKLAQILNFDVGGATISSLAIILHNGKTTYAFASNNRPMASLRNARKGLGEVLDILKSNIESSKKEPDDAIEQRLLHKVLTLNQIRIRRYVNTLLSKEGLHKELVLQTCINKCDVDTPDGAAAKTGLTGLANSLPNTAVKTEDYIPAVIRTIRIIQFMQGSRIQQYISTRAAEDHTMTKGGSWSILKHVAGRLLSYQYAVEVLVRAHHVWAETDLFRDFEIASVRPSAPYQTTNRLGELEPVESKNLLNPEPEVAEMVVNRAPGTAKRKEALVKHVKELEKYKLGSAFQGLWREQVKKGIHPVVHAEILLHSWLMATEGDVQRGRFFQGWQFIGTSKPLCRMCTEYFNIIPTPVRFRSGHPNTYLNWRLPDPYVDPRPSTKAQKEKEARIKWCEDFGKIKERVFVSVGRVLDERVAEWKRFDSNTYTSKVKSVNGGDGGRTDGGGGGDDGLMARFLGAMQIGK